MNREDIIARLRANEVELRGRGVAHAALFGTRARGEDRPDSDTDIMIELPWRKASRPAWRMTPSRTT